MSEAKGDLKDVEYADTKELAMIAAKLFVNDIITYQEYGCIVDILYKIWRRLGINFLDSMEDDLE